MHNDDTELRMIVSSNNHRLEQADFAVVYHSPSIEAGPDMALFQKFKGGELSGCH